MTDQTQTTQPTPEAKPADKPQDKRKTVFLTRLSLTAPCPGASNIKSTLYWAVFDGNPRLVVKTNDPADTVSYGKITAAFDPWNVGVIKQTLQKALDAKEAWKMKVALKNTYRGNQNFDSPQHINDIVIGKDAEGVVYMSVIEQDRPQIKFPLLPSEYVQYIHADGTPLTPAESSAIFTAGYIDIIIPTITNVIGEVAIEQSNNPTEFRSPGGPGRPNNGGGEGYQKKPWQGNNNQGGGGGGYQRNNNYGGGGQGGGYQKKPWQGGQGGGGGYQNRQGGGGGNWNRNNQGGGNGGGGGGNYQNRQQPAPTDMKDDDIPF